MKNHQNHFLGIQNIIGSPNFSHQNHWISIIWDGQDSQKLHLQDHPIRLRQWQLRTLCLKELPELGVWPRSAPHRVIRVFIIFEFNIYIYLCNYIYIYMYLCIYTYIYNNIYIYIYTKETVFERISHNKQVLDGLGDAAAHASTNWMTLYFSQDLQSADQFSEAKQTQPVHLQHHPACHSSML